MEQTIETGGYEYYIRYRRGNHELRKVINEDNNEYDVICSGSFEKCIAKMEKIKAKNFTYDYS